MTIIAFQESIPSINPQIMDLSSSISVIETNIIDLKDGMKN